MANEWLRLWHDMPTDPKWRTISRASGQPIATVQATYLHLLVDASRNVTRGHVNVTQEDLASALDVTDECIKAVIDAMQGRVLDGDRLTGWELRQPKREDTGDAESGTMSASSRKRAQREREKLQGKTLANNDCHAVSRNVTTDKDKDKEVKEVKETAKAVAIAPAISPALPDEKKPAKSITPTELALLLALGIDRQLSIDFLTLRKAKKAPLTQRALDGLTREAGKAGISLDEAIDICIDRSWTGFNSSWNWQSKSSQSNQFGQGKGEKQISNLHDAYHAFTQCDMPSQAGISYEN